VEKLQIRPHHVVEGSRPLFVRHDALEEPRIVVMEEVIVPIDVRQSAATCKICTLVRLIKLA
jgi:hypothetical protein